MKKIILFVIMAVFIQQAYSQQPINPTNTLFPKTIQVNGSAEMEIVPDEIFVIVSLKEFDRKNQGKVDLEQIKADFLNSFKTTGLADSLITIASYEGSNGPDWWRKKKKKDELYASINYQVKFTSSRKMDELIAKLDDNAVQNFQVIKTSHSKITELRKQLKIQAIMAAKEKAVYLAAAIDEQIGAAITIEEPIEFNVPYVETYSNRLRAVSVAGPADESGSSAEVDFKKLKLRFDVKAVFALK